MICKKQLRRTNGRACGLDFKVIARVADDMGIITDATFWETIAECEDVILSHLNEK